jgi:fucose permease
METALNKGREAGFAGGLRLQIALSFFAFILIGANDGALGVLIPSIRNYYGIDKATVGLIFLAGTAGYFSAGFSSGLLVEKLGQRLFLMLGPAMMLIGASMLVLKPPFLLTMLSFLLIGFGVAVIDAGLNAYIAGLPRSTSLLNYLHAFYGIGALIGPLVASAILTLEWGWNNTYILWIMFATVLIVSFGVLFKRREAPQPTEEKEQGNVLAAALRLPVVWLAAFFLIFYVGAEVSLGSWSFTFLTEYRHEAELFSGWTVSGYWMGLTLGRLILARIAERTGSKRMIQVCLVGVVTGVLLVWLIPVGAVAAFGLGLTGFSLGPIFPTTIALMPNFVPARLVPSAIGFVASLGSMGAALLPWIAGNLAEGLGLWSLLPYVIGLTLLMLVVWMILQARHPETRPETE